MTCTNTYDLECQEPCGLVCTGMISEEGGVYFVTWEDGADTIKKQIRIGKREEICFRWPFGTHGIWIFQITDADGVVVELTGDPSNFDCFQVVGIPTYTIDPGELATLEAECNPA